MQQLETILNAAWADPIYSPSEFGSVNTRLGALHRAQRSFCSLVCLDLLTSGRKHAARDVDNVDVFVLLMSSSE